MRAIDDFSIADGSGFTTPHVLAFLLHASPSLISRPISHCAEGPRLALVTTSMTSLAHIARYKFFY